MFKLYVAVEIQKSLFFGFGELCGYFNGYRYEQIARSVTRGYTLAAYLKHFARLRSVGNIERNRAVERGDFNLSAESRRSVTYGKIDV